MRTANVRRLASVFTLSSIFLPLAAGAAISTVFTDVPHDAWFASYVSQAADAGIVSGYVNQSGKLSGHFGPADNVTLAQALKIAVVGAGYDPAHYIGGPGGGPGVGGHWAAPYLLVAAAEHFKVFEAHETNIDRPATRAEVAQIFADAFKTKVGPTGSLGGYTDVDITTSYAAAIAGLSADGVIAGDADLQGMPLHRFRPTASINRAETAKIVILARGKYGEPGAQQSSQTSMSADSSMSSSAQAAHSSTSSVTVTIGTTVHYNGSGFSPVGPIIIAGQTVAFMNDSDSQVWIASNPHPTHTDYPGFDALRPYNKGESYSFTFTKKGTWYYHNHLNPSQSGEIIVQ